MREARVHVYSQVLVRSHAASPFATHVVLQRIEARVHSRPSYPRSRLPFIA